MKLTNHEQSLLNGWEEVFKKGQLTLWVLLALKHGPKYMGDIKAFIGDATNGALSADDVSMYRALRRYTQAELVDFTATPGKGGPDRKVYSLTPTGQVVLRSFCERNIAEVFYKPAIQKLIRGDIDA